MNDGIYILQASGRLGAADRTMGAMIFSAGGPSAAPGGDPALLLETGDYLLLETGDNLLLE